MGDEVNGSSFIVGYLLGRRRAGTDPLAITLGTPSTVPRPWRWVAAAVALGASLAAALVWWDLTTGVGWLRLVVLGLVTTGAAMWLAETLWERRTPESSGSTGDDSTLGRSTTDRPI